MPAADKGNSYARQQKQRKRVVKKPAPKAQRKVAPQAAYYVSQGKAVEKVANRQKKVQRKRRAAAPAQEHVSQGKAVEKRANELAAQTRRAEMYRPAPPKIIYRDFAGERKKAAAERAVQLAPVLKVLDQTTRPLHGIAAGSKAAVEGKNVPKAALRGIQNKDKSTFSDVLKSAGVKNKTIRGVAGLVGDVALDPTTYLTGGTASVARKEALRAAAKAAKGAAPTARVIKPSVAKGATKEAKRAAARAEGGGAANPSLTERASARKLRTGNQAKGVTVKFAGKQIPGVTKASAVASAPVKKAVRKATPGRAKYYAADINPNVALRGVSKAVSDKAINATRTARGKINTGERDAIALGHGIRSKVGDKNYNRVVDAGEERNIKSLPSELRPHAITLRSQSKYVRRIQRQAGVKVADLADTKNGVKGYVYRQLTEDAAAAEGKKIGRGGGTKATSSKARTEKRPLSVVREESPGKYREDLHALSAERLAHGTSTAAKAGLNRDLANLGRDVKRGSNPDLQEGEAIFHVKGSEIAEVTDKKLIERITTPLKLNKKGSKVKFATPKGVGGRFVVLNRDLVARSLEGAAPTLKGEGFLHGFDKTTSAFKRIALATPGFHVRNLVGDTAQAYVNQPGRTLGPNLVRAKRTTQALARSDKAKAALEPRPVGKGRLKTTHYGHVSYHDLADNLIKHGAARSGYTARELKELSQSGGVKKGGKVRQELRGRRKWAGQTQVGQAGKRALLSREDIPRIATAIHALQNGATWEQAARSVADTHFDYAHLTSFERNVARRLFPFYTWSARNIPFTAKNVVAKPGKYANFQKLREEATKTSGVDEPQPAEVQALYKQLKQAGVDLPKGWEQHLTQWEQRNAGVPVSWKGHKFTVSMGLPLQDLNEFPGAAGKQQLDEYYQKAMSLGNPVPKDIVEYMENHSFFFRDELQRKYSPNVAAPAWVTKLGATAQRNLKVVKIQDKKSGKWIWGWPGKMDYLAKVIPGTPNYIQQLSTSGADRKGRGTAGKALAFAGVKSSPVDPVTNAVNLAYARMQAIEAETFSLRQQKHPNNNQKISAKNPTPEYTKLNEQLKLTKRIAFQGKTQRKDAVLPTQGGPKKKANAWDGGSGGVEKWDAGGGSGAPKWGG